jgi:hypothetical protein
MSDTSRILLIFVVHHIPLGTIKFTSLKRKETIIKITMPSTVNIVLTIPGWWLC